jgi:aldehyde dehydrogenase (NAD+)
MARIHGNLIAGEWTKPAGTRPDVNPSNTQDIIGEYAAASREDTLSAIAAAKSAFAKWSRSTIQQRHDILRNVAITISERREELGRLLSREEGKTLAEGIGEVGRASQIFNFFAGECLRMTGQTVESVRPNVTVDITREPIGVVGVITPWNFPMAIPAWKIAPALAFGNTVVFKPADLTPGCAWALADILHQAGLPAGVMNLVMGRGSIVGETILQSSDVNAISFTGSIATGKHVASACSASMRKFQLEMGGKNPLVVLDDAALDVAVECAINSAYFSTGQRCTAASRLIVTDGIYARFIDLMKERAQALVVDDALKDGTQIGPVVSEEQLEQNLSYLKIGQDEGATLCWGGERLSRETPGHYLQPALFVDTDNSMRINKEEIFGPIATVIKAKDYDEALQIANETPFGLSAGLCTTSLKYASHFKRNAEAGMVMINLPTAGVDYHVPFGGRKASSLGAREQGSYAAEFYTTVKTSYVLPV